MKSQSNDFVFSYPEDLDGKGYLIATYFLAAKADVDIITKAASFAVGQSVGTWVPVPGITQDMLERHMARVVAIYDIPPAELIPQLSQEKRYFLVQIAFPEINFGFQFPMLFTTLLGNDVSTSTQLKLVDLRLSSTFVAGFSGPKFGISGVRHRLGIEKRPILLNMIKPCTGYPVEVGARFFAEVARGGVDIIKDDELLGNPSFNLLLTRVKAYQQAATNVFEETGHRTIYCANITDRPDRMVENARRAQELGAGMIMINAISSGLGMVQAIAEDPLITIPILSHFAGAGALTECAYSGISSPLLLGKFNRLAGSDLALFSSIYSSYPLLREKHLSIAAALQMPLFNLKKTMPAIGGGICPNVTERIVNDIGYDVVLAVGGAIQGHPDGSKAGAQAMRQAIDAVMAGVPIDEYAKKYQPLKVALEKWSYS